MLNEFNKNNRTQFTLRKLAKQYKEETGIEISKSTIHNYLRKRMGYKYMKSTIKTDIILKNDNLLISFAFIKIIARCLKLGFSIIYCDESYIQSQNNDMRVWRKPNEDIYAPISKKEKLNLILSVNENGVVYFELNRENTKESNF